LKRMGKLRTKMEKMTKMKPRLKKKMCRPPLRLLLRPPLRPIRKAVGNLKMSSRPKKLPEPPKEDPLSQSAKPRTPREESPRPAVGVVVPKMPRWFTAPKNRLPSLPLRLKIPRLERKRRLRSNRMQPRLKLMPLLTRCWRLLRLETPKTKTSHTLTKRLSMSSRRHQSLK